MNLKTEVLIVGGGTAGMFASVMCGMLGIDSIIIDAMSRLGGQCMEVYPEKSIYDIPGFFEIKAKDLIENLKKQMSRFPSIKTMFKTRVIEINKTKEWIKSLLNNGEIISKYIIFASGDGLMTPNKPNFANLEELENRGFIQYFMNDLNKFKNKTVAILGGGDSALDWCLTLEKIAKKIYLIHRRITLRAMQSTQEHVKKMENCKMLLGSEILSVKKEGEFLDLDIQSPDGSKIKVEIDYIVPCYGMKSENNFVCNENIRLDLNNRIIVDPATSESNVPGIYGIGDASAYENKNRLIVCGFGEATNAIYHIAKKLDPTRSIPYSTSILG